jgi:hypothetical protein
VVSHEKSFMFLAFASSLKIKRDVKMQLTRCFASV